MIAPSLTLLKPNPVWDERFAAGTAVSSPRVDAAVFSIALRVRPHGRLAFFYPPPPCSQFPPLTPSSLICCYCIDRSLGDGPILHGRAGQVDQLRHESSTRREITFDYVHDDFFVTSIFRFDSSLGFFDLSIFRLFKLLALSVFQSFAIFVVRC